MFTESVNQTFLQTIYEAADPRARDRPLMGSPVLLLLLCIFYVVVNSLVNKNMQTRKAFNTKPATLAFYLYLVIASGFFSYKFSLLWLFKYSWLCEPLDTSNSAEALEVKKLKLNKSSEDKVIYYS
jgi:hypothetical protein